MVLSVYHIASQCPRYATVHLRKAENYFLQDFCRVHIILLIYVSVKYYCNVTSFCLIYVIVVAEIKTPSSDHAA